MSVLHFEASTHTYWLDGVRVPGITSMLERTDWTDSTWFTPESRERGSEVHALCASYDLGALDVSRCESPHRSYVLAHQTAMSVLQPTWTAIEEPAVHVGLRFAGTPDRVGLVSGLATIAEIKSGATARSHAIQTALQALLVASEGGLPAELYQRIAIYLKPTGRFSVVRFSDPKDFREAKRIIAVCCGG